MFGNAQTLVPTVVRVGDSHSVVFAGQLLVDAGVNKTTTAGKFKKELADAFRRTIAGAKLERSYRRPR
jgi:hypothetical protein